MKTISDRKTRKSKKELDKVMRDIEKDAAINRERKAKAAHDLANVDCNGRPITVGCIIIENDHPDKPRSLVVSVNGGSLLYRFEGDDVTRTQFAYTRDCTLVESFTISEAQDYLYRQNETRPISKDGKLIELGDIVQEDGSGDIGRVVAADNEAVIIRVFDPEMQPSNAIYAPQCTMIEKRK